MSTIIDLMLAIKEGCIIFYHKDTNQFDYYPYSQIERKEMSFDKLIPKNDINNFRLPSYKEIDHKDIMRFYVKECVEDKETGKQFFNMLRRDEYMDS